jgi:hypothetical protein
MKKYEKIYFYLNIRTPKSWVDYPSPATGRVFVVWRAQVHDSWEEEVGPLCDSRLYTFKKVLN